MAYSLAVVMTLRHREGALGVLYAVSIAKVRHIALKVVQCNTALSYCQCRSLQAQTKQKVIGICRVLSLNI